MELPKALLESLEGIAGYDSALFEQVHRETESVTSIRVNPAKIRTEDLSFPLYQQVPWCGTGYYLSERPSFTFDPLFHAGLYYVQEASSMFVEQALKQVTDLSQPLRVLDLCAAPGGKSTHLQSLVSPESLVVANEVIRSRAGILKDNLVRWGSDNVVITQNDPADFSSLPDYFDVILVDAPCSGSGLFRRDPDAIGEWSENNVMLCQRRQQRILADILPSLKTEGLLIYSTCSYSAAEDEEIAGWLEKEWTMESVLPATDPSWGIVTSSGGYRFWPHQVKGEGFFLQCFRKKGGGGEFFRKKAKPKWNQAGAKELSVIKDRVIPSEHHFILRNNTVQALPGKLRDDIELLVHHLHVLYSGIIIGELVRDKLIPDHALAMSRIAAMETPFIELDYDQAIEYLKRKDPGVRGEKGWKLVRYKGHNLGWVNALPNRINNYYPRELRILKDN